MYANELARRGEQWLAAGASKSLPSTRLKGSEGLALDMEKVQQTHDTVLMY